MTDEIEIARVETGSTTDIRIRLSEWHGKHYADVRKFITSTADERSPTRKGVAIPVERLDDVINGLNEAKAEAQRQGLLQDESDGQTILSAG